MAKRRIVKIITAITGYQIIIGELELRHAQEHFLLPDVILLEINKHLRQKEVRAFRYPLNQAKSQLKRIEFQKKLRSQGLGSPPQRDS